MPPLSRTYAPRLLSTVKGKPYATQDDHENTLPTPPASNSTRSPAFGSKTGGAPNVELYADPVSDEEITSFLIPARVPPGKTNGKISRFRHTHHGASKGDGHKSIFKLPGGSSPQSTGTKRSAEPEHASSDSDGPIFSSQDYSKRRKPLSNIHALIRAPKRTYGKQPSSSDDRQAKASGFRKPAKQKGQGPESAPRAIFKVAKGVDMFQFRGAQHENVESLITYTSDCSRPGLSPNSSPLTSLPSDDEEGDDVEIIHVATNSLPDSTSSCPICGSLVGNDVREDFEDDHQKGAQFSYRWQQRFCVFHRRRDAEHLWREQKYPEIDWSRFGDRLRRSRHRAHLLRIINGDIVSVYRRKMERNLKTRNKTALQAVDGNGNSNGTSVGYYGPRGEKMMTDFILADFADALRDHAKTDRLIAASGVQGGVSGFVQAVLVPELAVSLVQEDVGPDDERDPVEILTRSADIGDLLHPAVDDKVHVDEDFEDE